MLPYHGRWRNASKRALEREARLLMFASGVNTHGSADDDEDDILPDEIPDPIPPFIVPTAQEIAAMTDLEFQTFERQRKGWEMQKVDIEISNTQKSKKRADRLRKKRGEERADIMRKQNLDKEVERESETIKKEIDNNRRKAISILNPNEVSEGDIKSYDVLASAAQVNEELSFIDKQLENVQTNMVEVKKKDTHKIGGESIQIQINGYKEDLDLFQKRINGKLFPIKEMKLDRWENGEMEPGEFVEKLKEFVGKMNELDELGDENGQKWTDEEKKERKEARAQLLADTERVVADMRLDEVIKKGHPSLEEAWKLKTTQEKNKLIKEVTEASQFEAFLQDMKDEVEVIQEGLKKGKILDSIKNIDREIMDNLGSLDNPHADPKSATTKVTHASSHSISLNPFKHIHDGWNTVNQTFGVEWITLGTLLKSFEELKESIKEVKKRKQLERISRGAVAMGRFASLIPGLGGKDLIQVLEEQQEKKKSEIVESYKKELGDNRNDFGFTELFGKDGHSGQLRDFVEAGDTNRTRAVIEFAAGKGLLFNIEGANWKTYQFPGGYLINDLLPHEWNSNQIESYFGNLELSNNKGKESSKKAGIDMVSGRGTADGYVEPFTGAINSLSIWFAQGIAEKAMSKVSDGEMSTRLTLAITDAWEHNKLFRENVPIEWLDRICGTGKQLVIGMTKYEKEMFVNGGETGETDISKIKDKSDPPRESQLGKLVVASRNYLFKKDPGLKAMYENEETRPKFLLLQSRLLASQPVPLPNGAQATIYSPELRAYQLVYGADMMRDAPVADLGDDFFIKRSEIIRGNAAIMKAVGNIGPGGFAYPTKARYFFSHILMAENELQEDMMKASTSPEETKELQDAARSFRADIRKNLDQYMEYALQTNGGETVLTEQHKQDGRPLFLTLAQKGMISLNVIEKAARQKGGAGVSLLRSLAEHSATPKEMRERAQASLALLGGQGGGRRRGN